MTSATSLERLIEMYGHPIEWTPWMRYVNGWRLIAETIEARVVIDCALHGPDTLKRTALQKLGSDFDVESLDLTWPGRGEFEYPWMEA